MLRSPPGPPGPAGVYLHFPFCAVRCSYCDFPTLAGRDDRIDAYLDALEYELLHFQEGLPSRVDTVYFGGGTPSRMEASQVRRLIRAVRRRFELADDCEITLECNPENLDRHKLAAFRAAGVTRVSIGIQSLDDAVLRRVGRAHDGETALSAARQARETEGLEVAVDLIAGLPGEDLDGWSDTVGRIGELAVDHVSVYLLELDKDTPLARSVRSRRVRAPDDDALATAYGQTVDTLVSFGFELYEISNFSRRGRISRHNTKYWTDGWFAGFGLGAHAYFGGARRANRRDLAGYLEDLGCGRDPLEHREPWDPRRRLEEALILGLRRTAGLDLERLGRRYGQDLCSVYEREWNRAVDAGLLRRRASHVWLTEKGRLYSNELFADLIGDRASGQVPMP